MFSLFRYYRQMTTSVALETENILLTRKHICICDASHFTPSKIHTISGENRIAVNQVEIIAKQFCGLVEDNLRAIKTWQPGTNIYLTGDIGVAMDDLNSMPNVFPCLQCVYIVDDLAYNTVEAKVFPLKLVIITSGQVPLNVHGIGVYVRDCFPDTEQSNFFSRISGEHKFQDLTDSNKPSLAFRTGIYISQVTEDDGKSYFHLLRCSSNFSGPTDNLRATDKAIMSIANQFGHDFFADKSVSMNHILAQIYWNHLGGDNEKAKKVISFVRLVRSYVFCVSRPLSKRIQTKQRICRETH